MQTLDGFNELAEELAAVAKKATSKETQKKALTAGAEIIVKSAQGNVNNQTGHLRKNIGSEYVENGGNGEMRIGFTKDGFYGRFLEFGFNAVGRKKRRGRGKGEGRFVKKPMIQPAWESDQESVLNAMLTEYEKEMGID